METPRLFYVYPGRHTPSGGHKQMRLMVSLLVDLGIDACLLPDGGTNDDHLYDIVVPRAPFDMDSAHAFLRADDIVFLPEARLADRLLRTRRWKARRAVNNQNGFFALAFAPLGGYRRHGIDYVVSNAPYVTAVTCAFLGGTAERVIEVPHWVLRPPFEGPGPPLDARPVSIAYMPRKLPEICAAVKRRIEQQAPDVSWIAIHGMPEREVAQQLRSCRLLFSTQHQEGCPLPALEAMSCGTVVAGFGGTGPFDHPYANATNGFWARDESVEDATDKLRVAIEFVRRRDSRVDDMIAAGLATAERYSRAAVRDALRRMVERLRDNSSGGVRTPVRSMRPRAWAAAARLWARGQLEAARRSISDRSQ